MISLLCRNIDVRLTKHENLLLMKKILVPIDFSGHTDITCRYAIELGKVSGAEIKLFHTYFDQIIIADTSFPDTLDMSTIYNEELMKEIYRQAEQNMSALVTKLQQSIQEEKIDNITIISEVVGGEVEHELRLVTREYAPDLIVMGTTGKGNNLNVWGKVSTFIIDHSKAPVLTVPEIKKFHGFHKIMFAADLTEGNAALIENLFKQFSEFKFQLNVVHFLVKQKQTDAYDRMKALQQKFGKEEKLQLIRFEVVEVGEDNQQSVDAYCQSAGIDLIAFQPHKRSLFYMIFTKKITKKNLFATNIPLLAIPAI